MAGPSLYIKSLKFIYKSIEACLGTTGQADDEVEREENGDESLAVVLHNRILVTQSRDDRLRTSKLYGMFNVTGAVYMKVIYQFFGNSSMSSLL